MTSEYEVTGGFFVLFSKFHVEPPKVSGKKSLFRLETCLYNIMPSTIRLIEALLMSTHNIIFRGTISED